MKIAALISFLLIGWFVLTQENPKTITSDESAVAFAKWQLQRECDEEGIDCSQYNDTTILRNKKNPDPDDKYRWFIGFSKKKADKPSIYFVISEWDEYEISGSVD